MDVSEFDFELPAELIAQSPVEKRSDSRLLVAPKDDDSFIDARFSSLCDFIEPEDLLVFNDTRVIPARLLASKVTGGKVEIFIERMVSENSIKAMIKSSNKTPIGTRLILDDQTHFVVSEKDNSFYELELVSDTSLEGVLKQHGHIPLPPYIERSDTAQDRERYQTIYAQKDGAVAAPTAGLHFDKNMFDLFREKGIRHTYLTLHVGAGTFQPVRSESVEDHQMHTEWYEISEQTALAIENTRSNGGRIIAVGTTSLRAIESASQSGRVLAGSNETNIFIYPGYSFKTVDMLITNFHLPKSTLLMLVSAFSGQDRMKAVYQHAVNHAYRFFSYGDASLLYRQSGGQE